MTISLVVLHGLGAEKSAANNEGPLQLQESDKCVLTSTDCDLTVAQGAIAVETRGGSALVEWSTPAIQGPVELRFRLKTSVVGDEDQYIAYWLTPGNQSWSSFRRIPFHADGQWHDYRLPLADRESVVAVRFAFGGSAHHLEIADVRLETVIRPLSPALSDSLAALPKTVEISLDSLRCQLDCRRHAYAISDARTGRIWTSEPASDWLKLTSAKRLDERRLQLQVFDQFANHEVHVAVEMFAERGVRFTIEPTDAQAPLEAASVYPPRFATDMTAGNFVFCDRSCGVLLDQRDPTYGTWPLRVYGNTHCLDMPWIGLYDKRLGDGMMLLVETPTDAEVALVAHADGRHWPEVRWRSSLDAFRYGRTVSLRFADGGGYVRLAKDYRSHLQSSGRLRTLREKAAVKPNVERLRGAASLWGARSAGDFLEQLRTLGVDRGIVGNCRDPAMIAKLNELGYLTGRYDSFTDILEGPVGFQTDDVMQTAIRSRPGGPPKHGWKLRQGGQQMYWRSSADWLAAKRAYVDLNLQECPYTSRFIDVAGAAELLEDYHPEHTFDRRQDLRYRRQLFDELNRHSLVLGTEHGNDWLADQVDYFEGTMSGPFWWSSWDAGYLDPPKREQLSPDYLKFGMGYAHRVPLWELVYHDSTVTTWYWGDTAGMMYHPAPELADRKDLLNILYGTPPLIWVNGADYKLPDDLRRMLRTYHDTCPLHQVIAFEEMLDHEFLSEDLSLQRTRYANGTEIVVNFSDELREFRAPTGLITLAPRGYWAVGPMISQTRLWIDGAARTVISKDGYLTVEASGAHRVAGVKALGRVTMFRVDHHRWNCFLEEQRDCEVNVPQVTGWTQSKEVCVRAMDEVGKLGAIVARANENGVVNFRSAAGSWRFALMKSLDEKAPMVATESPSSTVAEQHP